jgi:L-fuconolactonase
VIDAHQHFWRLSRADYGWLSPANGALYRDFEPENLAPLMEAAGIERSVVVQAAPTLDETHFLLALAGKTPWVAGVVGWVDLERPDASDLLAEIAGNPTLRGVRPMIQDIPDPDWMLGRHLSPAFDALVALDLALDALVMPRHLSNLLALLERHPDLRTVIDHAAKPAIAANHFGDWAAKISRLARQTGAFCKLSGFANEAAEDWTQEDLRPYVDHVLSCFGAERVMWGSDWPVVEAAGGYVRWREASLALLGSSTDAERRAVLGKTAERFYALPAAKQGEGRKPNE